MCSLVDMCRHLGRVEEYLAVDLSSLASVCGTVRPILLRSVDGWIGGSNLRGSFFFCAVGDDGKDEEEKIG